MTEFKDFLQSQFETLFEDMGIFLNETYGIEMTDQQDLIIDVVWDHVRKYRAHHVDADVISGAWLNCRACVEDFAEKGEFMEAALTAAERNR